MNFLIGLVLCPLGILFLLMRRVRACLWLGALCLFSSMIFLSVGLYDVANKQDQLWQDAENWETAQATVLFSKKDVTKERRTTGSTPQTYKRYRFELRYRYTVDSIRYENSRYTLSSYNASEDNVEALVRRYPVGSEIEIIYDPDNPGESTVIRGKSSPKMFFLGFAAIPALIAFLIAYGMLKVVVRRTRVQGA